MTRTMTTMTTTDLANWRAHVLDITRKNQPREPRADWKGVFLLDAAGTLLITPTSPFHTRNPQDWQKALTVWFPGMIVTQQARAYALVDHVWQSEAPQAREGGTAADPTRREAVLIGLGARLDDGEIVNEVWNARVTRRTNQRPALGPWEQAEGAGGARFEALHRAIVLAGRSN